jgi:pimeloyl-ACP methyl ester carboxylesterase
MPDLADLFPGYDSKWINTRSGRIFARVGGNGPPLLLLHGFSETHVMWHRVAPQLADKFTLIIADLPGYGWSDMPESDKEHTPYTKRAMARTIVEAMQQLGHVHFALAGHDRGGRVSYRLALDHPGRLSRLAVLDILPTYDYWERMDRLYALKIYHWTFLAQAFPMPETLIGGNPDFFLKWKMANRRIFPRSTRARSNTTLPPSAIPRACTRCARTIAPAPTPISRSTRPITTRERRSRFRCWRCGAMPASHVRQQPRSTPGRTGRPMFREDRSIPVISSPKKIRP